jgi:pyruvate dehydrogenase E2 component (dihydrolipoamide acetyltransferase)
MIDVIMPQMGESIVEGTLTKWLKKAGDHVERDEPLFEISTDKVDTEIPSPSAGTLSEIIVEEGKTVGINTVVGRISDGANGASAPAPAVQTAPPQASPPQQAAPTQAPPQQQQQQEQQYDEPVATVVEETAGPLSPLVRKMARENNIDLSKVKGTGAGARITKQDLENYLASSTQAPPPPQAPPPQAAAPQQAPQQVARPTARRCSASATSASATDFASRRRPHHTHRADEHDAPEDRRAHGVQQAHLGTRDHGAQGRYDQDRENARSHQR